MNIDEAQELDIDDAMLAAESYLVANKHEKKLLFFSESVAITLAAEVERLRAELAETKAENVGLEEGHFRLEVELAAAKATSVPPVKFWWCYESNECDILIHGMNDEDSTRFGNWLDDRMKDKTPPEA